MVGLLRKPALVDFVFSNYFCWLFMQFLFWLPTYYYFPYFIYLITTKSSFFILNGKYAWGRYSFRQDLMLYNACGMGSWALGTFHFIFLNIIKALSVDCSSDCVVVVVFFFQSTMRRGRRKCWAPTRSWSSTPASSSSTARTSASWGSALTRRAPRGPRR